MITKIVLCHSGKLFLLCKVLLLLSEVSNCNIPSIFIVQITINDNSWMQFSNKHYYKIVFLSNDLTLKMIYHLFAFFPSHSSCIFRLCGASKSSNDVLLEQPSTNTFHDS